MTITASDMIMALGTRVSQLERRVTNKRRTGKIAEIGTGENAGKYRVELSKQGGRPYLTPWMKSRTLGAGTVKIDVVRSLGEQVDVISENGDMTDAVVDLSIYSDENARENGENVPFHIKIGDTVIQASDGSVTITATKIVLDGEVHLGGEGGQKLHRKGDVDSGGDTAIGSASRVFAV